MVVATLWISELWSITTNCLVTLMTWPRQRGWRILTDGSSGGTRDLVQPTWPKHLGEMMCWVKRTTLGGWNWCHQILLNEEIKRKKDLLPDVTTRGRHLKMCWENDMCEWLLFWGFWGLMLGRTFTSFWSGEFMDSARKNCSHRCRNSRASCKKTKRKLGSGGFLWSHVPGKMFNMFKDVQTIYQMFLSFRVPLFPCGLWLG